MFGIILYALLWSANRSGCETAERDLRYADLTWCTGATGNLILTRLAANAGHRAMSNLHSTIYNPTVIYNPIHPIYTPNMISSSALARYQS